MFDFFTQSSSFLDVIFYLFVLENEKLYMVFEYIDQDLKVLMERLYPRPLPYKYIKVWFDFLLEYLNHGYLPLV